MQTFGSAGRALVTIGLVLGMAGLAGCTTIREKRGYIVDPVLTTAIRAGIDNQRSVTATLGHPTFTSQFGQPTWYYVASDMAQRPFQRPRINTQSVTAVTFDANGDVVGVDRSGVSRVVYLSPDGAETPTLGRERSFLEDLFGNIGTVGAPGAAAPTGP